MPNTALKFLAFTACNTVLLLGGCGGVAPGSVPLIRQEAPLPGPLAPLKEAALPEEQADPKVKVFLDDINDFWRQGFTASGQSYKNPALVFTKETPCTGMIGGHGCYTATSNGAGVIYSTTIYLDPEITSKPLELMILTIAHEIGHHVDDNHKITYKASDDRLMDEWQAICLSGVWAAQSILLTDTTRDKMPGYLYGDESHGTTTQIRKAFRTGLQTGSIAGCSAESLRENTAEMLPEAPLSR